MTVLDKDQLLASFPDNNEGQITPSNIRDFVDSVELKYDNYVVVKPGQPNGNAFPDPVGGKITLVSGTAYVINGSVTVDDTIVFDDNTALISLSGNLTNDQVLLDAAAVGIAAFENTANANFVVENLTIGTFSPTATVFNLSDTGAVQMNGCAIIGQTPGVWNNPDITFMNLVGGFAFQTALQFTGTGSRMSFNQAANQPDGIFQTTSSIFDLTGIVLNDLDITGSTGDTRQGGSALFEVVPGTATRATVRGNRQALTAVGPFINGVDTMSVNWTFSGNTGIQNTKVIGGIVMAGNAVTTINPGIGVWTFIQGSADVLIDQSVRFSRPGTLQMQYDGVEDFDGINSLGVSFRRAAGSGAVQFSVGLAKNGTPITNGGVEVSLPITVTAALSSATIPIPSDAQTGDIFQPIVRGDTSGTVDTVFENLQLLQE